LNAKAAAGLLLGAMFLLLFLSAIISVTTPWPAAPPGVTDVGSVKWESRSYEVLLQGIILLAGVVAIILLLGSRKRLDVQP
jgi:NADH:ubiquinone oxidoreductase subunit 6 (subunit J)